MAIDKTNYERITVDLGAMRKLSSKLREDGDKLAGYIGEIDENIRQLGFDWEDQNYARFMLYYADRETWVRNYDDFAQDQAEWLDKAIKIYESLASDVEGKIGPVLEGFGL